MRRHVVTADQHRARGGHLRELHAGVPEGALRPQAQEAAVLYTLASAGERDQGTVRPRDDRPIERGPPCRAADAYVRAGRTVRRLMVRGIVFRRSKLDVRPTTNSRNGRTEVSAGDIERQLFRTGRREEGVRRARVARIGKLAISFLRYSLLPSLALSRPRPAAFSGVSLFFSVIFGKIKSHVSLGCGMHSRQSIYSFVYRAMRLERIGKKKRKKKLETSDRCDKFASLSWNIVQLNFLRVFLSIFHDTFLFRNFRHVPTPNASRFRNSSYSLRLSIRAIER